MKISLVAAVGLTLSFAACAPPSAEVQEEAEEAVTERLGLSGLDCLECALDAFQNACSSEIMGCANDLESCLQDLSQLQGIATCVESACGATCSSMQFPSTLPDDGGPSDPPTDPSDPPSDPSDPSDPNAPQGDLPDDGGTCPPGGCDDGSCDGGCDCGDSCDCGGGGCDVGGCDDILACAEGCLDSASDEIDFLMCLEQDCAAGIADAFACGLF